MLNPNHYSQRLTLISIEPPNHLPNAVPSFVENYLVYESLRVNVILEYKHKY